MKVLTNSEGCTFCTKLKRELEADNVSYVAVEVSSNTEEANTLKDIARDKGIRSLPVIFLGGTVYGSGANAYDSFLMNIEI